MLLLGASITVLSPSLKLSKEPDMEPCHRLYEKHELVLVPGADYRVTFALAGNPAGGPPNKTLRVRFGGVEASFRFDTTYTSLSNMGWQVRSLVLAAESRTAILSFESLTDGYFGPALDDVRVEPVDSNATSIDPGN